MIPEHLKAAYGHKDESTDDQNEPVADDQNEPVADDQNEPVADENKAPKELKEEET